MTGPAGSRGTRGWTIGRVAGIEVRMHPTFLVLVAMAVLGLLGPPVEGLVWIALVFACIVAHELGHATVARRRGMVVRDIVLLPIGGASEIDELADRPEDELAVAIAGPLVSIALAVGLGAGLVLVRGSVSAPSLGTGPLADRLLWANAMLAGFNLLPALPMDGGRVLRALLARRVGFAAATRTAARVSRQLAAVMAVVGVVFLPWLLLIAAFVYVTGRAEETAAIVHQRLAGVLVRDLMVGIADPGARPAPTIVRDTAAAEEAVQDLLARGVSAATVVDASGMTVGILLLDRVAEQFRDAA